MTSSWPAAVRSAWPTALHAARAGLDVVVREPRDRADRQGLRRGADARRRRRRWPPSACTRRVTRADRASATVDRTAAVAERGRSAAGPAAACAARCCTTRCADAVSAAGVAVERRRVARSSEPATTCWSTASRPGYLVAADGLHSPRAPARSGSTGPRPAGAASGCAATSRSAPWTSYVEVHWAPRRRGLRDAGRRRPGRRGRARPTARRPSRTCSTSFPVLRERLTGRALAGDGRRAAAPARRRRVGRPGAARRRRRRLRRRAHRRGHRARPGPGPRGRRVRSPPAAPSATTGWPGGSAGATSCSPTPCCGPPPTRAVRRRLVPAAARLPWLFSRRRQPARPTGRGARMTSTRQPARASGGAARRGRPRRSAPPTRRRVHHARHPAAPGVLLLPLRRRGPRSW